MKLRRSKIFAAPVAVLCLLAGAAEPEVIVFSGRINGQFVRLQADSAPFGDIDYVSLPDLVEGLSGGVVIGGERIRVDLSGITAWAIYGDERVFAPTQFSIAHPILRADNAPLIAVEDVTLFFAKAFQITLTRSTGVERPPSVSIFRGGRIVVADSGGSRFGRTRSLRSPQPSPESQIESIVIDPGHGGFDKGIEGRGGLLEKDVALKVGLALRDALTARVKRNIVLTRDGDTSLTLKERTREAAKHSGAILISIHVAGSFSPRAQGFAVYYGPPKNRRGARASNPAAARLRSRLGAAAVDQGPIIARHIADALEAATGNPPRGVGEAPIRLLKTVGIYGLHVEVGCITNPEEEILLQTDAHVQTLAAAIAEGLASYLGEPNLEPAPLEPPDELLP